MFPKQCFGIKTPVLPDAIFFFFFGIHSRLINWISSLTQALGYVLGSQQWPSLVGCLPPLSRVLKVNIEGSLMLLCSGVQMHEERIWWEDWRWVVPCSMWEQSASLAFFLSLLTESLNSKQEYLSLQPQEIQKWKKLRYLVAAKNKTA